MGEDLKEYIDRKMRMSKIDSLLLYLTSLFGFLYSLAQFFFSGLEDIICFLPLLIPGMILPIYFGYYRGGLMDDAEDRVRGWLYLIFGTPFYALVFLSLSIQKHVEQYVSGIIATVVSMLPFLMILPAIIFARILEQKLVEFIFYLCGRKSSFATDKMILETRLSAAHLSLSLLIVPLLRSLPLSERLFFMIILLIMAYIHGRSSGKWRALSKKHNALE